MGADRVIVRTVEVIVLRVSLCVEWMSTFADHLGLQTYRRSPVDSCTMGEDMAGPPSQSMNTHYSTKFKGLVRREQYHSYPTSFGKSSG